MKNITLTEWDMQPKLLLVVQVAMALSKKRNCASAVMSGFLNMNLRTEFARIVKKTKIKKRGVYMRLDEILTAEEMKIIQEFKNKTRMEQDEILGELERRMSK